MSEEGHLERRLPVPSEGGYDATGLPTPVGAAAAALDVTERSRERRVRDA
jgi:hypothetical protein